MFDINFGKVSKIRNDCYYVILWNDYQEIGKNIPFYKPGSITYGKLNVM